LALAVRGGLSLHWGALSPSVDTPYPSAPGLCFLFPAVFSYFWASHPRNSQWPLLPWAVLD
jgi:hypothetical protein